MLCRTVISKSGFVFSMFASRHWQDRLSGGDLPLFSFLLRSQMPSVRLMLKLNSRQRERTKIRVTILSFFFFFLFEGGCRRVIFLFKYDLGLFSTPQHIYNSFFFSLLTLQSAAL